MYSLKLKLINNLRWLSEQTYMFDIVGQFQGQKCVILCERRIKRVTFITIMHKEI
jgi:hypothetical protein